MERLVEIPVSRNLRDFIKKNKGSSTYEEYLQCLLKKEMGSIPHFLMKGKKPRQHIKVVRSSYHE